MSLTAKQEKFCRMIAEGSDQSNAYRGAYNALNMKAETINNNAYKLIQNNDIATRIAELKKAITKDLDLTSQITVERQLKYAQKAIQETLKSGDWNNYLKAMEMQNRLLGLNAPVRSQVTGKDGKDLNPTIQVQIVNSKANE